MSEFLLNIPKVMFSVALGSLISFVGVMISNKSNNDRLKVQLLHDEKEKELERKASLRKEVYLSTVEELTKANAYLGGLPQADIMNTNISIGIQGFLQSAAKLELVAEDDTGEALNNLVKSYMKLFMNLIARVLPIQTLYSDIEFNDTLHEEAQVEIKRVLAEMVRLRESGEPDDKVFSALQVSFEYAQTEAKGLTKETAIYRNDVVHHIKGFNSLLMDELAEIQLLQVPVLVCIRKELGIATDAEKYQKRVVQNAKEAKEMIETLYKEIDV